MSLALPVAPAAAAAQARIRVMVVDDSVVVRGLVSTWIEEEPDLAVVASVRNGQLAVDYFDRTNPDVVLLDVDMPVLDGIAALPLLLKKKRDLIVIMASTLTRRNAEISLRALSLGAADYIPKPETSRALATSNTFRRELIEKVRALGGRRKKRFGDAPSGGVPRAEAGRLAEGDDGIGPSKPADAIKLRPFSRIRPQSLLIGSSTGGPQALTLLISQLADNLNQVPMLITQHMPPTFTTILADHLSRAGKRPVHEAVDGQSITPGGIYLAPGGWHMRVARGKAGPVIALDDGALINFCKPAVDPLFQSAVEVWGDALLAVVLTGMGSDGSRGAAEIAAAGGSIIAQDEATSVVWGMPGAVAAAGLCSAVLPLESIGPKITQLFGGRS